MTETGRFPYLRNLFGLLRGEQLLRPLAVTYYLTTRCNLNCAYCEDFGARRNRQQPPFLPLAQAQQILRVIRDGCDSLILTGGEPLLYPHVEELVAWAKETLRFRQITLLSNGLLLPRREGVLAHVDRLVVSLDSVEPAYWASILNVPRVTARAILDNVQRYGAQQQALDFRLILNCVLAPETLPGASALLDFCRQHRLLVSFSPQAVDDWPRYELLVSEAYKTFVAELRAQKRQGGPILGSDAYLETLHTFAPYACYPTLVPRVMADGALVYPCRPIERKAGSNGGRPVNLLHVAGWDEALAAAVDAYGPPPQHCTSCFQQCFAEPSLMQARPLARAREWARYPQSRGAGLHNHAPG